MPKETKMSGSITEVRDDVAPVAGPLVSGASTNDTDLTVRVNLTGTQASNTVRLYNGTDTATPLGVSHTVTSTDIGNGSVVLQTGVLTNATTYNITARVTAAGAESAASNVFAAKSVNAGRKLSRLRAGPPAEI